MIEKKSFGFLKDGREIHSYTIYNKYKEYVQLLDYGATIHSITVRDQNGKMGDVVLGAADADYIEQCSYRGGTIGRCANRIAGGRYEIDGRGYQLEKNQSGHFIHGASGNYANKFFDAEICDMHHAVKFRFKDTGEGGFSCNVDVSVTFSFSDDGKLELLYEMVPEDITILNPTNHTYFNLSEQQEVKNHVLKIYSDYCAERDEHGLPNGGKVSVIGGAADFTNGRMIRDAMESDIGGYFQTNPPRYDEFYLLSGRQCHIVAELYCPENGRRMDVYTDMPCIILFLDGSRKPEVGKIGKVYEGHCGICLETGFVPNAVNCPAYDSPIFKRGMKLVSKTVYHFFSQNEIC